MIGQTLGHYRMESKLGGPPFWFLSPARALRMKLPIVTFVFAALAVAAACGERGLKIQCRVTVPKEYRHTPFNPPPNGDPEPARYTVAYEAYWWNCVAVRAANLDARCPFTASGTAAAVAGAGDGASNAGEQICDLLRKHSKRAVQRYLRSIASQPIAAEKMGGYFEHPRSDPDGL